METIYQCFHLAERETLYKLILNFGVHQWLFLGTYAPCEHSEIPAISGGADLPKDKEKSVRGITYIQTSNKIIKMRNIKKKKRKSTPLCMLTERMV
jgi:hypothetical protein